MENQADSQFKHSLIYGGMYGLTAVVLSIIAYILGWMDNRAFQWVGYTAEILFMVIGIKKYREQQAGGFMSYGKAFSTGFLIGLIGGIISLIYFYIFISFIDKDFIQHMMEKAQEKMTEQGMSDEQMEKAMHYQQKFTTPGFIIMWGGIATVIMSLIFSAITAIFMKKKDESFEGNFR